MIARLKQLKDLLDEIESNNLSLNGVLPKFVFSSKYVFEEKGQIYRIEEPIFIKTRIAFSKMANEYIGAKFFAPETLIEENSIYGISVQKKIKPFELAPNHIMIALSPLNSNYSMNMQSDWEEKLVSRVYSDYGEKKYKKIVEICQRWNITGINPDNVGISANNRIQCFDYIADASLGQEGELIGGN